MKLVYLDSAKWDLAWYRSYYETIFSAGAKRAAVQYLRAISNLRDNPHLGHPVAEDGTPEYSIPRTPFSIVDRVIDDRIEIMRVWDQRANRRKLGFEEEGTSYL